MTTFHADNRNDDKMMDKPIQGIGPNETDDCGSMGFQDCGLDTSGIMVICDQCGELATQADCQYNEETGEFTCMGCQIQDDMKEWGIL